MNIKSCAWPIFNRFLPDTRKTASENPRLRRPFSVVQIEITSRCYTNCIFCPHGSLRVNSSWESLLQNIENLVELKSRGSHDLPWLELHCLMTRTNLGELSNFVRLAASLGADEVVATNLTYAPTLSCDNMRAFGNNSTNPGNESVTAAQEVARQMGIPFRVYSLIMESKTMVCDAEPVDSIFINHLGEVIPCIYLGLSACEKNPRYFLGQPHPMKPVSFGNIEHGLQNALDSSLRGDFISASLSGAISALIY